MDQKTEVELLNLLREMRESQVRLEQYIVGGNTAKKRRAADYIMGTLKKESIVFVDDVIVASDITRPFALTMMKKMAALDENYQLVIGRPPNVRTHILNLENASKEERAKQFVYKETGKHPKDGIKVQFLMERFGLNDEEADKVIFDGLCMSGFEAVPIGANVPLKDRTILLRRRK